MQTASGLRFHQLDPRPDEISLADIAHSLSLQCRFGGHCPRFYSVAEHSVLASLAAPPLLALPMLLHDAAEAYVGDVIRPLKQLLYYEFQSCGFGKAGGGFDLLEHAILNKIKVRFDCVFAEIEVKPLDERMLATEARELFGLDARRDWGLDAKPYDLTLPCWPPEEAERQFLARFHSLAAAAAGLAPSRLSYTELREGV